MKQIILLFMAVVMMTTSSFAMSPAMDTIDSTKDYATVATPVITHEPIVIDVSEISDWDYFWGTIVPSTFEELGRTLDPVNTGWNDFWYQCQDPDKDLGACVGTVAAGIGLGVAVPIAATLTIFIGSVAIAAGMPSLFTAVGTPFYIAANGSIVFAA